MLSQDSMVETLKEVMKMMEQVDNFNNKQVENLKHGKQTEELFIVSDNVLKKLIGKNADYYMNAFEKVKQGQRTKFMWSSLLFSVYFVLYRNCMTIFKRKYLIPILLIYVTGPMTIVCGLLSSLPTDTTLNILLLGIMLMIGGLLGIIIVSIQLGFCFPKLYYKHLLTLVKKWNITEENVDSFVPKYSGAQWKKPVIFTVINIVIVMSCIPV